MCVTVVVTSLTDSCELSLRVHLRTEPRDHVCGFSSFGGLLTHPFNLNTNSFVMSLWLCSCFSVVTCITVEFSVA